MAHYSINTKYGIKNVFKIEDKFDWLESRGGRTFRDILDDNDGRGEYVTMTNGAQMDVKVFIPRSYE